MSPHIVILGTCDTKLQELLYLRSQLLESDAHCEVTLIDAGRSPVKHQDITIAQDTLTSKYAPSETKNPADLPRGEVIKYMIACATNCVAELYQTGLKDPDKALHGIVSAGGTGGTSLVSAVMREVFPVGFPKLIVSTAASGDTGPVVGETDISMMYSVVDIAGTNLLLKRILSNAAGAIVGMAQAYERSLANETRDRYNTEHRKKRLGITMFGVTTPCVDTIRTFLEANYPIECFIFHCTGHGGKAMERLVTEGKLDAVLDLTTTEICDYLMGGNMSAGPHRLEAALKAGIPNVISLGATDMVNFGPKGTVPEKYRGRKLFEHNPVVTLMRTSPEECKAIGDFIVEKIKTFAKKPEMVQVVLPKGGVSTIATPDAPFYDAEGDEAIFSAVGEGLRNSGIVVHADTRDINDGGFAKDIAMRMVKLMGL